MKAGASEVRVLATAKDASVRSTCCYIRKGLLASVRNEMPVAMPRRRVIQQRVAADWAEGWLGAGDSERV